MKFPNFALRCLPKVFHLGLAIAVALLLQRKPEAMQNLLWVGIVHMLVLYGIARKLVPPWDRLGVHTLHKSGFLHTLIGLAASALMVVNALASNDAPNTAYMIAAPMGSALLPHVLGLWLGHAVEIKNFGATAGVDDYDKRVADSAEKAFRLFNDVRGCLERLSRELETTVSKMEELSRRSAGVWTSQHETMQRTLANSKDLQTSVKDVASTTREIVVVHRQIVDLFNSRLLREAKR